MNAVEGRFVLPVIPRRGHRRSIDLPRAWRLIDAGYSIRSTARLLRVPRTTLRAQLARAEDNAATERAANRALALREAAHRDVPILEARHDARERRAADKEWRDLFRSVYFVGVPPIEWDLGGEDERKQISA